MAFFKNMLSGKVKRSTVAEEKPEDNETDTQIADIFEDGHKLTALENIGSSLTTLWSSCGLNVVSSSNSQDEKQCQTLQTK
ncbi:uncharacterized protein Dmoj_GI27101 [Drosophila mojavensis]|uniref:Uncharacterized protein n=1 Tax=Drosophila mojavensis TaxID=7230 RepID=A0A0Q9WNF0_DROMO|nr:uncharacterized protein Dmoj_GI27101 [Drosophila mojavensis]